MLSYKIEAHKKSVLELPITRWWVYVFIILALSLGKSLMV